LKVKIPLGEPGFVQQAGENLPHLAIFHRLSRRVLEKPIVKSQFFHDLRLPQSVLVTRERGRY
jgi:hypothetical protein